MDSIIFMTPIFKDYIWGGNKLKNKLNKNSQFNKIAESWEISANKNGNCRILNKEYKGKTLNELFNNKKIKCEVFGKKCEHMEEFPLLIKFIDAKENLSIQVHPDDDYAHKIGQRQGKNELWYIIDCEEDSQIISGLKENIKKEDLKEIIESNTIKNYLNYINVEKGNSIYIEAGTIHAILKGNLICEIQQNCDITYRVYDWDRSDQKGNTRMLHKKEALEVIKPYLKSNKKNASSTEVVENLTKNEYFITDKIKCVERFKDTSSDESFFAINIVKGQGIIRFNKMETNIKMGDSFIIPATLGDYEILGDIELLKSYIS